MVQPRPNNLFLHDKLIEVGNDYRTIYLVCRREYTFDLRIHLYRTTYSLADGRDAGGEVEEGGEGEKTSRYRTYQKILAELTGVGVNLNILVFLLRSLLVSYALIRSEGDVPIRIGP